MILHKECKYCQKKVEIKSNVPLSKTSELLTFTCGHSEVLEKVAATEISAIDKIQSIAGKVPFPFQKLGIKFGEDSNLRCLIADEMGLGKTMQALLMVKLHKDKSLPCIIVCKSIAKANWYKEILHWCGIELYVKTQIISNAKDVPFAEFDIHIISFDMLRRVSTKPAYEKIFNRTKTVIIDESHLIKNTEATRTTEVKKLCVKAPHIIALSGTPIKNNASEYFSILNILHPEIFNSFQSFVWNYVDFYDDGYGTKYGGLKYPDQFKAKTKDFIIRREMTEVLPELPTLSRNFQFTDLSMAVQKIYDKELEEFAEFWNTEEHGGAEFFANALAKMARLRHITGLSKIDFCQDFLMDFVINTNRKMVVFVHHKDVMLLLKEKLDALLESGGLKKSMLLESKDKDKFLEIAEEFQFNDSRVLIASTLAGGESINLQFASDCIMLERQWNPANEMQAEARFKRIGQVYPVTATYLLAVGTIDEYFSELVERKRQYFEEAMRGEKSDTQWNETSLMMELGDILSQSGKQKWSLEK